SGEPALVSEPEQDQPMLVGELLCRGWIMEDFMHFIKYAWPYVFQGIMTEGNLHLKLWRLLVDSTLHYLTPGTLSVTT
ncbi:hypothetical protein, partial [Bosea sp. (in: a-proteobacteria)]|uniref:hypothetical protein n=1 Tax=Bosea sp. (in: a-proteobacteria) TaxID=1871050 RepID=UPI004034D1E5